MRTLKNILFWISTVCLIAAILLVAVPKLFGVEFRAVVTGSMTPEIPVGSLVIIVPTAADQIKIGDDISFITAGDKVVTHRVIRIDLENNEFITWGIANEPNAIDAPNKYENILGVVKLHIPVAGQIFSWLSTVHGKIITATIIIAIFIASTIIGLWSKDKKIKSETEPETQADPTSVPEQTPNTDVSQLFEDFDKSEELFKQASDISETETNYENNISEETPILDNTEEPIAQEPKKDESLEDIIESDDLLRELLGKGESQS